MLYRPYLLPRGDPTHLRGGNDVEYDDLEQAVAAVRFGVRFIVDLASNFNEHVDQKHGRLANLATAATISCGQALEHISISESLFINEEKGFIEIYKTLKTFSRRWKVGGAFKIPACSNITRGL